MRPGRIFEKKLLILTSLLLSHAAGFSEQLKQGVNSSSNQSLAWYLQPWPWVAAAAFLSVAVISALRGIKR